MRACFPNARAGFTLLEVLVVVAILTTLMTLSLPAMMAARNKGNIDATSATLKTMKAMIISDYGRESSLFVRYYDDQGNEAMSYKWDFNGDSFVDGDPAFDFDSEWQGNAERAQPKAYTGFLAMLGGEFGDQFIDRETGGVRDYWGTRIKILFHPTDYGAAGFMLQSAGPDFEWDTEDDLKTENN